MFFPALSPWRCILVDTDTARRTRGFAARQLRASCHQRAPEPCSSVCSFVERSSPFSSSVCPSCLSKTLLHLLWIFFSLYFSDWLWTCSLHFNQYSCTCYKKNALHSSSLFLCLNREIWLSKTPSLLQPDPRSRSCVRGGLRPLWGASFICMQCTVCPSGNQHNEPWRWGLGQGRELCCHDNTNCNKWLFI